MTFRMLLSSLGHRCSHIVGYSLYQRSFPGLWTPSCSLRTISCLAMVESVCLHHGNKKVQGHSGKVEALSLPESWEQLLLLCEIFFLLVSHLVSSPRIEGFIKIWTWKSLVCGRQDCTREREKRGSGGESYLPLSVSGGKKKNAANWDKKWWMSWKR